MTPAQMEAQQMQEQQTIDTQAVEVSESQNPSLDPDQYDVVRPELWSRLQKVYLQKQEAEEQWKTFDTCYNLLSIHIREEYNLTDADEIEFKSGIIKRGAKLNEPAQVGIQSEV